MRPRITKRGRGVVALVVLALCVTAAAVAYVIFSGSGPGVFGIGEAPGGISVTAADYVAPPGAVMLYPGDYGDVQATVTNNTGATVAISDAAWAADTTIRVWDGIGGCDPAWFTLVKPLPLGSVVGTTIANGASATLNFPGAVKFDESGTDQSACNEPPTGGDPGDQVSFQIGTPGDGSGILVTAHTVTP